MSEKQPIDHSADTEVPVDKIDKAANYGVEKSPYREQIEAMSAEELAVIDKKLLRKIDIRIIPWITLLYLMSFLDRVNVGTAKLENLLVDLKLDSDMFRNVTLIFFVSYVFFEVPSNLVLKKLKPSIYIPVTMICWAIFQIFMGVVKNYTQLLILRFFLGMFEAGLFPGLNFYLNGWYRREELARRTAIFFAGAVLAGAFGGILGYGFGQMKGVGGKSGWVWIFVMEGLITFIIACASFWMVHDWPEDARFLTEFERELVAYRLEKDTGFAQKSKFTWKETMRGFKDWKTYVFMLCYVGAAQCIYSQSLFSPTIIASLGTWSTAQSLLLSVPPYVLAFFTTIGTAFVSDHYMIRGPLNMFWSVFGCIGYAILLAVPTNPGAKYFAVFLSTMSIAPLIAITIVWCGNTFSSAAHYKKAVAMGMIFSSGNAGGIWSALVYTNNTAPRFKPGHGTALGFCAMNGITSLILWVWMRRENKRRDEVYGPVPGEDEMHDVDSPEYRAKWGLEGMSRDDILSLGDDHPAFRYTL